MNHELDINILSMPSTSGPTIRDYSDIITGDIILSNTVSMGGHDWVVCNIDYTNRIFNLITVLASVNIYNVTYTYIDSTAYQACIDFAASMPAEVTNKILTSSLGGGSCKVFIPTYTQYAGGFTLFDSNPSVNDSYRTSVDSNNNRSNILTSSFYGSSAITSYYININGSITYTANQAYSGKARYACTLPF